ncbi:hypothetical protein LOD99_11560 [Oopsacas minuta]|uniref:Uncharacterized protein n=1 Tax=Oopsacas minuta TaxID=111878 RepID=A0AAV7JK71_9METZ|nr:hypothetical protein LOD99_11560 [Oopsacas minuta]
MANRGFQKRGYNSGRRQHSNPHPRYQPLPPIPPPPRPGQSELNSPFSSGHSGDYKCQFQFEQSHSGKGRYKFGSSSNMQRSRGKGSYHKNYHETDITQYYSSSMLENPWGQLMEEFNQSYSTEITDEPELIKPTDLQIGTIKDQSFYQIQNRNQDIIQTPLSEFTPDTLTPHFDTSPVEQEIEPYIPTVPTEIQRGDISLADELISPFGAQESKGISSLSTNEITELGSDYEPYVPTGGFETGANLQPYTPINLNSDLIEEKEEPNSEN